MKGLGKIPYVSAWVVLTSSFVLFAVLDLWIPAFAQWIMSFAAMFPYPLGPPVCQVPACAVPFYSPWAVILFFSGILTVILKILDAPKPRLGSGQRFSNLEKQLEKRPGVHNAPALAAHIGAKKVGRSRMQKLAAAGRRRRR